jgi:hypothetical protein
MVYSNNFGQTRVGIRNVVVTQVVNAVDADATAFIAAAGITDLTQAAAISTLVNDLKTYGIWSKMKALYPFVGGSAASHKFNLKDPRDLDAAFRLVFTGGWTHTSNGIKGNGTTGYADTKLIPSSNYPTSYDMSFGFYSRTDIMENSNDISAYNSSTQCIGIDTRWSDGKIYGYIYRDAQPYNIVVTNSSSAGLISLSRTSTTMMKIFRDTSILGTTTTAMSGSVPNISIRLSGSVGGSYSTREKSFTYIGNGLSDIDTTNLYTAVQKFQTTLGRQVGTPYVSDGDAQSFLTAASITDSTQASAVNTLVTDLKSAGVWTKMKVIYPFIGGNATSHKFNLKDPRDLDAAYRLQFNGGWTHNSNGVTPNGSNGFARTFFVDTNLSINSVSYSIYNRSNTPQNVIYSDFGYFRYNSSYVSNYFTTNYAPYGWGGRVNSWTGVSATRTDYRGFYNGNRTNSTDFNFFLNGTKALTQNDNTSGKLQTGYQFHLGCLFIDGQYYSDWSTNNYAFAHISDGLTDTEAVALHRAVQKYQTTLGRQIDVPLVSDGDAQAFLNAASITSYTQANAVNTLVVDLKSAGVWSKMKALYPFVGGSATSHKFNLKDPRDVDAAFRLVFVGGWTHTSTGAKPNGTNGYANTYLVPSARYTDSNSISIGFYSRTNISENSNDIGSMQSELKSIGIQTRWTDNKIYGVCYDDSVRAIIVNNLDSTGFFTLSRTTSTSLRLYKNETTLGSYTNTVTGSLPTNQINLGSYNGLMHFSTREQALAFIGDGLSDGEASSFYTAVQKFQTSLGRQIGTPVYNTNGLVLNLDAGNANSYPGTGTTWFDLAAGNNGTLVNGPTYDTTNGGSILFDGVNDYVDLGSNFRFNDSDITYDFWFKVTDNSDVYHEIITLGSSNQSNSISLWKFRSGSNSGKVFANINIVGFTQTLATSQLTGADILNTIVNYTAVFKKESGVYKLYLYRNGILDASTTSNVTSYNMNNWSNFEARIGSGSSTFPELWKGNIYSGKVYNRSLSSTEVLQNFNNTRGRFGL